MYPYSRYLASRGDLLTRPDTYRQRVPGYSRIRYATRGAVSLCPSPPWSGGSDQLDAIRSRSDHDSARTRTRAAVA